MLQDATPGSSNEDARQVANVGDNTVHCVRHLVGRVARHVFRQSRTEDLASRPARTACEAVDFREYLVRNRHRGFHTQSITGAAVKETECQGES